MIRPNPLRATPIHSDAPISDDRPKPVAVWESPTALRRREMAARPMRERFAASLTGKRTAWGKAARARRDRAQWRKS